VYRLWVDTVATARTLDDLIPFYCGKLRSDLQASRKRLTPELVQKELRRLNSETSHRTSWEIVSEEVDGSVAKLQIDEMYSNPDTGRAVPMKHEVTMVLSDGVWYMGGSESSHEDKARAEALMEEARDREKEVRELGKSKDPKATEALITALKDPDRNVRSSAAKVLGKVGNVRAVEPLIAVLKDRDEMVRSSAAEALGKVGDVRAVEPLIAVLKDRERMVRRCAAEALGKVGDVRAVEPLIAVLKDREKVVRRSVAEALGTLKDTRAVEPLIVALKDPEEQVGVRSAAAMALGLVDEPRATKLLLASWEERNLPVIAGAARFFISRRTPGSEEVLIQAMDKHGDVDTARALLTSGNKVLSAAAQEWIRKHGYEVRYEFR
jgi:HEAT repeat protein